MRKFRSVKDDRPFRNRIEQICIKHQINFLNWTAWKLPFFFSANIPVFARIKEFDIHAQRCAYIYAYICLQTKHCIHCCHKFSCQDQIYQGVPSMGFHRFPSIGFHSCPSKDVHRIPSIGFQRFFINFKRFP